MPLAEPSRVSRESAEPLAARPTDHVRFTAGSCMVKSLPREQPGRYMPAALLTVPRMGFD